MTIDDIKYLRLTSQYLLKKGKKLEVAKNLNGFQAQFLVNAIHSMKIRCEDFDETTAHEGLVKNWTIRGTVHVFAEDDLALYKHCDNGRLYRSEVFGGYRHYITREWTLTPERQAYFSRIILDSLTEKSRTREELKEICVQNGMSDEEIGAMFDQWGGGVRELCERGFMNYVVREKKEFCLSPDFTPISEEKAKFEIARRYFTNFGPVTIHDAQYYFHTTASQVKTWLNELPVKFVSVENSEYFYIENGRENDGEAPRCIFLSGFDQLMLGYEKKESLFLQQENLRGIFNLAGIVMPPILLDGMVVGKWKFSGGKLNITAFRGLSEDEVKIILDEAEKTFGKIKKIEWK